MLFTLTQMEIYKLFVPLLFFILKMSTYLAGLPPSPIKPCHQLFYVALYM